MNISLKKEVINVRFNDIINELKMRKSDYESAMEFKTIQENKDVLKDMKDDVAKMAGAIKLLEEIEAKREPDLEFIVLTEEELKNNTIKKQNLSGGDNLKIKLTRKPLELIEGDLIIVDGDKYCVESVMQSGYSEVVIDALCNTAIFVSIDEDIQLGKSRF